jgi:hypothetical protein
MRVQQILLASLHSRHNGQTITNYSIEVEVAGVWRDITVRGASVGVGTVDLFLPHGAPLTAATRLRWICHAASVPNVTISSIDLYLVKPP